MTEVIPAGVVYNNYVTPRHRYVADKITNLFINGSISSTYLSANSLGNSITQGSGTSGPTMTYTVQFASQVASWFGYGSANNWSATNYGVGGGDISNVAGYVAYIGDLTNNMVTQGSGLATKDYVLIMSLRNDISTLTVNNYEAILRATLRQALTQHVDVFFITEFPQINISTGAITDTNITWQPWYQAAKRICGEEGVSLVDNWQYWYDANQNGLDLRNYTSDGTHYNDAANLICANLIFSCFSSPMNSSSFYTNDLDTRGCIVGKYIDLANTSVGVISGLVTQGVGREVVKNEGAANCFTIGSGSNLTFVCPIQTQGVLLTMIGGSSNTGTATLLLNGASFPNNSGMSGGSLVREFTFYRPLKSSDPVAAFQYGQEVSCNIAAVGGQIQITGVLFVGSSRTQYNSPEVNVIEVGAWSGSTLPNGASGRQSSSIGDTSTIRFYGTGYHFLYARGDDQGKFTWAIDGGGATTVDAYFNGAATQSDLDIPNLSRSWHSLVITIATKNDSSSGNTISFGQTRAHDYTLKSETQYITITAGSTVQLTDYWERAVLHETLSGSPLNPDFVPGSATLVLRGTGNAVIRLER